MDNKPQGIKAFAVGHPFLFALLFFLISFCLNSGIVIVGPYIAAITYLRIVAMVMQSLFALSVLAWLGWVRRAGFNGPSQWRSLHLLWLPALLALLYLASALVTPLASAPALVLAITFALLAGLNEEAAFRGVILQALSLFGPLEGAALSALFFGLAHLNNVLTQLPMPIIFGQVIGGFLLGFGFAACRLRTRTIWPLIIFHALYDLPANMTLLDSRSHAAFYSMLAHLSAGTIVIGLIAPGLVLACYGLFLLRPRQQISRSLETSS